MRIKHLLLSAALLASAHFSARAQLLIGRTAGLTGPVTNSAKEVGDGAKLWLDAVNDKGGVNGQKIELITLDDKFDPKLAGDNARKLIEEQNVLAMFLTYGTPHTEAVIPLLDQYNVALIAPSTGAMVMHQPVKKHVFNVRSPYQHEAEKIITHMVGIGTQRIAIVHADDSFGQDALVGAQKGFTAKNISPVAVEKFDRSKPDFAPIVASLVKANPQSVLIMASSGHAADCIQALHKAGMTPQIATLSNNASAGFVKLLGDSAKNVLVSEVFPSERAILYPMIKEAQDLAKAKSIELSPAMLEGYAGAKVLVEALRLAGPKPTRDKIQTALEGMRKFDLGGLEVGYTPTDHTGLNFVELSIISQSGRFKR